MKKLLILLSFPTVVFAAGIITPPTPRTSYGQSLMLATDATQARNIIGITPTNNLSFNANQFAVDSLTNLFIKSGSWVTNTRLWNLTTNKGTIINEGVIQDGTVSNFNYVGRTSITNLDQFTNVGIVYVRMDGNNTTALRNRPDKPCATLSNAVQLAQNGDTIQIEPGRYTNIWIGIYKVTANSQNPFYGKSNITVQGVGKPLIWDDYGSNTVISIVNCSNLTFRNIAVGQKRVLAPWAQLPQANVFGCAEYDSSVYIQFYDCDFYGNDWGIVDSGTGGASTNGIVVDRCSFYNLGLWIISQTRWDGGGIAGLVYVRNCYFQGCNQAYEPWPTVGTAVDLHCENNVALNCFGVVFGSSSSQLWGGSVKGNTMVYIPGTTYMGGSNVFPAQAKGAIAFINAGFTNLTISDNFISGYWLGLGFSGSTESLNILNNTIIGTVGVYADGFNAANGINLDGFGVDSFRNVNIKGNLFQDMGKTGITMYNAKDIVISDNVFNTWGTNSQNFNHAIHLRVTTNAYVHNNTFRSRVATATNAVYVSNETSTNIFVYDNNLGSGVIGQYVDDTAYGAVKVAASFMTTPILTNAGPAALFGGASMLLPVKLGQTNYWIPLYK